MNKDEFINKVNNPNHIPGIYNYCDRWCERCNFTSKCANFSVSDSQFSKENMDMENEKFWDKIGEIFQITLEIIQEKVEEMGVDLNDIDDVEYEETRKKREEIAKENECALLSKDYYISVEKWFDNTKVVFDEKEREWKLNQKIGLAVEDNKEINDIIEIISWYQYQIHVKIVRALKSEINEADDPELWKEFPKDSEGSAKIALIGIDRSIASWGKMLQHFPVLEDKLLAILVNLQKLQRFTEKEFPLARAFKRVGFDD